MSKISTKPPSGMRDFLPAALRRRRHVVATITRVYESHGFVPLETPTIENLSTLTGKYGDEGDQLLYRVLRRRDALRRVVDKAHADGRPAEERDLADEGLRYDLTVPLARVVAEYGDLPRFFKRYQIQPVWRADRPGRGRFREFYQCDVDIVGTSSAVAEAEVCGAVASVLEELGFSSFEMRVNHRQLLRALVRAAGIDAADEGSALVAVDKLDKIGDEGVIAEFESRGLGADAGRKLLDCMALAEGEPVDRRLDALAEVVDEEGRTAIADLRQLFAVAGAGRAGPHLVLSPTLARGLSYYTGPIFEISVPDLAGSLGGGGRYDGLVGMFGKSDIPAVGFSLGLERILVVMDERGMYPDLNAGVDCLLCWRDVELAEAVAAAARLRAGGVAVEVYPEPAKFKKQLKYATSPGVDARFVAILGESERASGDLKVKELATGDERSVKIEDAVAWMTGAI